MYNPQCSVANRAYWGQGVLLYINLQPSLPSTCQIWRGCQRFVEGSSEWLQVLTLNLSENQLSVSNNSHSLTSIAHTYMERWGSLGCRQFLLTAEKPLGHPADRLCSDETRQVYGASTPFGNHSLFKSWQVS